MTAEKDDLSIADLAVRSDVVEALGRVLSSPAFATSQRSRTFLSYVVSEALAGRGDGLSERTVARGALGRGPAFDGVGDASVRVTATRVRQALDRYYAATGATERLRILLPTGGYAPRIESRSGLGRSGALAPGVAVLTPDHAGDDGAMVLAAATADALVARLGEYESLTVVGPTSARDDLAELGWRVGVSHVLNGRVVMFDGQARFVAQLMSTRDGVVVWSQSYDEQMVDLAVFDVGDRWAREVAARIADHGGVVVREVVQWATLEPETGHDLRARLAYYAYIDRSTKESIEGAIVALDEALALGRRTAPILAMRGAVANAAVLQGLGDQDTDTSLAEQLAREALTLDAQNAHAYLVLGGAARARHRWTQCRRYADEAAHLAPWQPANLVSAGLLLAASGKWAEGMELVERALHLNPGLPVHSHLWLALGNIVLGHYDRALGEATLIDVDGEIFGPLYRALALSGLGNLDDAREEIRRLQTLDPRFFDDIAGRFTAALNLTKEQVDRIVTLLNQARP